MKNAQTLSSPRFGTRKLVVMAMLTALAFLSVLLIRVPVFEFLSYEPKDVIITIGGFLYGPLPALMMSVVVSLVEMVTISSTGIIGCIMNILSTAAFACAAAVIYKHRHTLKGAIAGLFAGVAAMTAVMLLWNFLVTPLYMGVPRDAVVAMLLPVFLPFNLIKAGLNGALVLLLYKPVSRALKAAGLRAQEPEQTGQSRGFSIGATLTAAVCVVTCILLFLAVSGKI